MLPQRPGDELDVPAAAVTWMYVGAVGFSLVCYGVAWITAGDWMVLRAGDLWNPGAAIGEAVRRVWFVFAWALALTVLLEAYAARRGHLELRPPGLILRRGAWISLNAGVFEELIYRWLLFFTAMVVLRALNAISLGAVEWMYTTVLLPLVDVVTFGALSPHLVDHPRWLLGAALVSANAAFRRAHQRATLIGRANSWAMGMVYFWLLLTYDMRAAMVVHTAYDLVVFTTVAASTALRQRRLRRRLALLGVPPPPRPDDRDPLPGP